MKKIIAVAILGMFALSSVPAFAQVMVNDNPTMQIQQKVKKPIKKPKPRPTTDQPKPKPKPHLDI